MTSKRSKSGSTTSSKSNLVSTAHIFYVPVLILVGVFAGYFIGRHAAEEEERERRKKARRRAAASKKKQKDEPTST